MQKFKWIVSDRGQPIATFRYRSDAERYVARVAPRENFTISEEKQS